MLRVSRSCCAYQTTKCDNGHVTFRTRARALSAHATTQLAAVCAGGAARARGTSKWHYIDMMCARAQSCGTRAATCSHTHTHTRVHHADARELNEGARCTQKMDTQKNRRRWRNGLALAHAQMRTGEQARARADGSGTRKICRYMCERARACAATAAAAGQRDNVGARTCAQEVLQLFDLVSRRRRCRVREMHHHRNV